MAHVSRSRLARRMTGNQLQARGFFDMNDPPDDGQMPNVCSYCGAAITPKNPMNAAPTMQDPSGMLRGTLMRTKCRTCDEKEAKMRAQRKR